MKGLPQTPGTEPAANPATTEPDGARLGELEIKLSYAEDLLDSLNTTVFRQQEQIASLQRQILDLHRQIQSMNSGVSTPMDELPPHY